MYDPLDRVTGTIANCTNTGTTQPAAGATCAGTGTADAVTNLVTTTYNDAAGTTVAVRDTKGITLRSIPNVRGLAKTSIANCTDAGTTPTPDPRACTGAGTHDATANVVTTTTYDGTGATVGTTVAVGTGASATTETAYDAAGRAIAVKDPVGTISRNLYNAAGQLATTIVNCTDTTPPSAWAACAGTATPDGTVNVTTTYAYDAAGNQASLTAPNGRVTTSVYDADARLITRIENDVATPSGPAEDVTTSYFYDAAGRLAAVQAPTTDGSTFAITRSVYDAAGRLVRQIANCVDTDDPANCGGADGQTPGTRTFEQNVVTDYAYDDAGNLTRLTPPDPSAAVGGTGSVTTRYAYDTANRLCRVLEASTISDAVWTTAGCTGAVSGTTSTNLSTRYAYDAAGNLATATDAGGHATTYAYDTAGHLLATTDPDGGVLVYAYDALGQKIRQENRSDPPMTASVTWTYDGAGRIVDPDRRQRHHDLRLRRGRQQDLRRDRLCVRERRGPDHRHLRPPGPGAHGRRQRRQHPRHELHLQPHQPAVDRSHRHLPRHPRRLRPPDRARRARQHHARRSPGPTGGRTGGITGRSQRQHHGRRL